MGEALTGFVIGLFGLDFVTNWWRSAAMSVAQGSPAHVAAIKATVNYYLSSSIKLVAIVLGLGSWINKEFNAATAGLGLLALSLAWSL